MLGKDANFAFLVALPGVVSSALTAWRCRLRACRLRWLLVVLSACGEDIIQLFVGRLELAARVYCIAVKPVKGRREVKELVYCNAVEPVRGWEKGGWVNVSCISQRCVLMDDVVSKIVYVNVSCI